MVAIPRQALTSFITSAMEECLPTSTYWSAEWTTLGKGKDSAHY
jgi:hypothetical protein